MIAVIRITGQVGLKRSIIETLNRLKIRKKYSCIVLSPTKEQMGMIKKVEDFVAYGKISEDMHKKLLEKRKTSTKDFFRLHPPRKGIDSKKHFGVKKGVLGNHKEKINELIERML